jgi:glucosamine-6-phosphate deaminase
MQIQIFENAMGMGAYGAGQGAKRIRQAIAEKGGADIILATGASQFTMLEALVEEEIDWSKVTMFHLDEYLGIGPGHPASFVRYLRERFVSKVDGLKEAVFVNGMAADPAGECKRLADLIGRTTIDVCFAGIGENGHLAFNDPPADFETTEPYIVVDLDEKCRRQQLGEGWFATLEDVPRRAISMSIREIMRSSALILSVPDRRKAEAVRATVQEDISPRVPASVVRNHDECLLLLDGESASLLPDVVA